MRSKTGSRTERPGQSPRFVREVSGSELAVLKSIAEEATAPGGDRQQTAVQLEGFLDQLLQWTQDSNLVAQNDLGRLASRHVSESLAVLPLLDRLAPRRLVDVGSGAGFPGIPIQIARPDWSVTLVESRRRKGLFLQRIVLGLQLEHAKVLVARAEHLEGLFDERFDVATARAVALIGEILPWLAPLVRVGGHAVLFKGSSHPEELAGWQKTKDPTWAYRETVPVPDRHLAFVVFERLADPS